LSNPDKKLTVALGGLRLQPESNPHWQWPWQGVSKVTWQNPSTGQSQNFSPHKEISFQGRTYDMTVLQDKGASVVWKLSLRPKDPQETACHNNKGQYEVLTLDSGIEGSRRPVEDNFHPDRIHEFPQGEARLKWPKGEDTPVGR
jgi:hypothetical protein